MTYPVGGFSRSNSHVDDKPPYEYDDRQRTPRERGRDDSDTASIDSRQNPVEPYPQQQTSRNFFRRTHEEKMRRGEERKKEAELDNEIKKAKGNEHTKWTTTKYVGLTIGGIAAAGTLVAGGAILGAGGGLLFGNKEGQVQGLTGAYGYGGGLGGIGMGCGNPVLSQTMGIGGMGV